MAFIVTGSHMRRDYRHRGVSSLLRTRDEEERKENEAKQKVVRIDGSIDAQ
jgi:hypothetical protein